MWSLNDHFYVTTLNSVTDKGEKKQDVPSLAKLILKKEQKTHKNTCWKVRL